MGRSYLVFGRANWTDVGTLSLSTIAAGSGGFVVLGEDNLDSSGNVAAAGDVNGDGLADFIIGAPGSYGLPYTGKSYVVFGKANSSAVNLRDVAAGTGGFVVTGEANYDSSGASVSAAGDINGDGLADLLVGAFNNDAGGSNAGRSYVIFGGTQWIANTVQGSGAVTGTSASEAIIGSSGADTLTGNGGIDRFFAGAGNDTIALTSSDIAKLISTTPTAVTGGHVLATIDGGAGIDSIQLFGGANLGANLDLSAISNSSGINPKTKSRIASIERIDLASDSAANSVTVSVGDVVDMAGFNLFNTTKGWTVSATGTVTGFGASTPYHQLLVDGTATDGIVLTSSEWMRQSGTVTGNVSGISQSYSVYVNSAKNAMLLVGSVIQRIPPPPVLRLASDTGISASDGISNNATITVIGLEDGATWQYRVDQGNWQSGGTGTKFNASAGQHSYSVRQVNAGITSAASTAVTFSLDTSPPSAPSIVTPIASDNTVNASEVKAGVTIQGRAEANASVTLKLSRISKTVFANASGDWLVTLNAADWGRIEAGTYNLTVEQTDVAGNGSNPATVTVTVENDAPLREILLNNIAAGTGGFAISVGATEDGTQPQEAGDRSGWSVSAAGDVNGDGWADVLIGAPESEAGGYAAGRGYVVFGKADGAEVNVRDVAAGSGGFVLTGETAVDQSGFSVSAAGDVNGDGLADLFVGAPARLSGRAGRSYVVFGKTNTSAVNLSAVAAGSGGFVISGEAAGDESGISVAALGDVNGDGLADLLIGARYNGAGGINAGRSYVVFGKTNTSVVSLSAVAAGTGGFAMTGEAASDYSGSAVSAAGDVNGDGLADLLVGAPYNDAGGTNAGRSYVIFGKANTSAVSLSAVAAGTGGFAMTGEIRGDQSGISVAAAGDVNGDGLADVLVGALYNDAGGGNAGRSYVVFGKANTKAINLSAVVAGTGGFAITGEAGGDQSGFSVSAAGDMNGDGLADLLVGAPNNDVGGGNAGRSYVIFGKANTSAVHLSAVAAGSGGFAITGEIVGDQSGFSVSAAGDVNGDGLSDLLVGAPYSDVGGAGAGRSYVVFGGTQWLTRSVQGTGTVTGTVNGEAIIGSSGADILTGNGGIDRFFAGAGDDTIVLTASDIANLASNTPSNNTLATLDGGLGLDSVRLTGGANLDLTAIKISNALNSKTLSRIAGVERIDLATDNTVNILTLSVDDVRELQRFNLFNTNNGWTLNGAVTGFGANAPYHQLVVDGTASDGIVLTSSEWVRQTGTVTGNVSGVNQSYSVYVNTSKNAMLLVDSDVRRIPLPPLLRLASDTGISASDNITNNATITVSGLESGAGWRYRVDGGSWLAGAGTNFIATSGQHSYVVQQTDSANNTSFASTAVTYTLTTTRLNPPTINAPIAGDNIVSASEAAAGVAVQGTAEANASLIVTLGGVSKTVTANASGAWNTTFIASDWQRMGRGVHILTVATTQTDVAGNLGVATLSVTNEVTLGEILLSNIAAGTGGFAITGEAVDDGSGGSVTAVGDVNGDGLMDVLVSAYGNDAGGANTGRSYVVFGKANSSTIHLSAVAAGTGGFAITGEGSGDWPSAFSVAAIGDMNGDGLSDVLIGVALQDAGGYDAGRSYVVFGKTNTSAVSLSAVAAGTGGFAMTGETSYDQSGYSVSGAGDVNGDGLADVIVGAIFNDVVNYDAGRSYVVFGKANASALNLRSVAAGTGGFAITGRGYINESGASVSGAGDVNGDGLADLLVGVRYNPAGGSYARNSYVVFGKITTNDVNLDSVAAGTGGFAITGEIFSNAYSGWKVAAAGDVNGDGLSDVLVSLPWHDAGGVDAGRSYVVFGKASGATVNINDIVAGTGGFAITGETAGDYSGSSLAAAGDVNGDGLSDVLVSAPNNGGNTGRSYVVFGKTNTSAVSLSAVGVGSDGFAIKGEAAGDQSGAIVSAAGDINGDGLADLLVGAPNNDAGGNNAGRSYVLFGGTQWVSSTVQGAGTVNGTAADEAIIGSSGADTLTGGGGVDRFFAGAGNDVIVLTASDIANLTSNTPTAVIGGSALASVDGGTGLDTIRLTGGANFDLIAISNSNALNPKTLSRIASIERIDLASDSAANSLNLRVGDVIDMTGFNLFNTSNGWTVSGAVTGFGTSTPYHQLVVDGTVADGIALVTSEWVRQTGTVTGSVSGASQSYTVYVNTSKNAMLLVDSDVRRIPLPPVLQLASDTGISASDNITNNATILVFGLESGASWRYQVDSGAWANGTGSSFNASTGAHSYSVQQVSAGNTSIASATVAYTLDTTPPTAPTITMPIAGDNAISAAEATAGVTITGTAEANTSVTLTLYQVGKTVTANASGAWTATFDATDWGRIGRGTHTMQAVTTDLAGNVGVTIATLTVANDVPLREILLTSIAAGTGGFALTREGGGDYSGYRVYAARDINVSAAGDINGDGFADFIIGAYAANSNAGKSYVVFGKANWSGVSTLNLSAIAAGTGGFVVNGEMAGDYSGFSVTTVGDINGDDLADVLIGAYGSDTRGADAGRSYVVFGRANWASVSALNLSVIAAGTGGFAINSEAANDRSGFSVSAAGDVNGDGLFDLLIGSPGNDAGGDWAGRSYVVFGRANWSGVSSLNLSAIAIGTGGFAITGEAGTNHSGWSISAAGDVNGDGLADVLIGAPYNDAGGADAGRSYVVFGKANSSAINVREISFGYGGFAITGEAANDRSGFSVSAAGDVNGDGLADFIIGAPWNVVGGAYAGRSYVVFGKANSSAVNLSAVAAGSGGFAITGEAAGDENGYSVSVAGDVNGDGLADLIVGAPRPDYWNGLGWVSRGGTGRSYVVFGKTDNNTVNLRVVAAGTGGFAIAGETTGDNSGGSVSAAGDINGDGLADLLVGAPNNDAGGSNAGRSYVIFGGTQWISNTVQDSGTVTGTSANEAIIGSSSADTLTGGGGIDRFFAGAGNDVIVLTTSDISNLASNTPTAVTGGSVLSTVDGGTGIDTIRLSGGARLDLTAIKNSSGMNPKTNSRIASIERIDLVADTTANTLSVRVNDVLDMAGFNLFNTANGWTVSGAVTGFGTSTPYHQLLVDGTAQDSVALLSSEWTRQTGTVASSVSGTSQTYNVYINQAKNAMLLVDADIVRAILPPVLQLNSDTGLSANDGITNNATIVVTELAAGATWSYQVDSTAGAWTSGTGSSFTATSGAHSYFVRQIDFTGNTSIASGAVIYTLDTTPPTAPTITMPIAGDNAISAAEATAGVSIQGMSEANASVTLSLYQVTKTVAANASGAWSATLSATDWGRVGRGVHTLTVATAPDLAGNVSVVATTLTVANDVPLREILLTSIAAGRGGFAITGGGMVVAAGDVNGDGLMDLLGPNYIVFGKINSSAVNLITVAADTGGFTFTSSANAISTAGDVNGDGLADLLVGDSSYHYGSGRTYVVFGKTNTSTVNLDAVTAGTGGFSMTGEAWNDRSGYSVSAAGDTNGDGLADLIVGAPFYSNNVGCSYVVFGKTNNSAINLSAVVAGTGGFVITGFDIAVGGIGNRIGYSVSGAGDINGDGLSDLLVHASGTGHSYVVFGKTNTGAVNLSAVTAGTGGFVITGGVGSDGGNKVSGAGDINGDGLADLLVGDPFGGGNLQGRSYVVFGKTNTSVVNLDAVTAGTGGFAILGEVVFGVRTGWSVSSTGDVNGDGLSDLLVVALGVGRSYVVFGKTNTVAVNLSAVAAGTGGFAITGENINNVSAAGDINGDGLADLLIGAVVDAYVIFGGTQWISNSVKGSGTVTGTSVAEAIIGSSGTDTLTGGGGVDRFFAGAGNDVIVLTSSDVTNLTSNTPTAVTGGSVLSTVDGGTGIDTLRLTGGANLDLTAISNTSGMNPKTTSRIASVERIDLATDTSANTLTLAVGDVIDIAGFNSFNTSNGWTNIVGTALSASVAKHQLVIDGTATDNVRIKNFLTAWTRSQTVSGTNDSVSRTENGATRTYHVYNSVSGNAQLLIDSSITPTLAALAAPEVASFSVSDMVTSNGAQLGKAGEALVFVVTMNESVTVNTSSGTPSITFSVNGQSVTSTYSAGTGTNTLTFTGGTVPATGNGNAVTLNTINLNGGTVVGNLSALAWATTVVGQAYTGYTVDNTALAPSLTLASDTGISASDNLTSNATINVSGLESGATWQYQVDNGTTWLTGTASSFTASEGTHSYSVRQTDAAGNTSTISTVVTYTLDTSVVAPTLALASDTGTNSSDNTTTNPTVLVTGLESGATWQYQLDSTTGGWLTGTASSFTASNGVHSYFVRQTDTAGNTSTISTSSYTLLGTPTLRLASDTGTSPTDGITNNATITVLGLLSGASWQYQVDSTAGAWTAGTASSFTASSGGHTYFVRQFDSAGNTSIASVAAIYTLDTSVVAPTLALASDTGTNSSDNTTTNPTILVTGLESGATWQYQLDSTTGGWLTGTASSFTASNGVHSYFVRQTDTAGNTSTISTSSYTLLGTPTLRLASDTGTSPTDGITNNATITVLGLLSGASWQYQVDSTAGAWTAGIASSFTASSGGHTYFVRQFDSAGNSGVTSVAAIYTLDTTPPTAPTITMPIAGDNTVSASEASAGVTITGTAEVNTSVTLTLYQVGKTVTANASGAWTATFDATDWGRIGRGTHTMQAVTTDLAGNVGATIATLTVANDVPLREVLLTSIAAGTGGFAIMGEAADDKSGRSVSAAGDVNGDGLADLLVGAYGNDAGGSNAGRSYVVFGKANTSAVSLSAVAAGTGGFAITGEATNDQSGYSVSVAGDVNGDGLADLLVGAYGNGAGGSNAGRSYVVFGKANTSAVSLSAVAAGTGGFAITGEATNDQSGYSVSVAGDVNGDGLADLLVGAPQQQYWNGGVRINTGSGRSYVVFGKANSSAVNLSAVAAGTGGFAITGEATNDFSGLSVSAAGDVNGDGLADLLVGAWGNDAGGSDAGRSYVVFGKANTSAVSLSAVAVGTGGFAITGEAWDDNNGLSVSAAGDVNGDGLADLLVGAYGNDAGGNYAGRSYVVFGKANTSAVNLSAVAAGTGGFSITGEAVWNHSGSSVSAAGDVNGDGLADLLMGAQNAGGSAAGRSYVVFGKANTSAVNLSAVAAGTGGFSITGEAASDWSGLGVSAAGDINGDGLADLLVGAYGNDAGGNNAGRSYVIFGGTQWISNTVQGSGTVTGTSANEAIIGSSGVNTLTGGGGIDRFFAGAGNDVIVLTASDITNLTSNAPTVVTGGSVLSTVDGGTGIDTMRLTGGASLDLTAISNTSGMNPKTTSRIASIERIDLATDTSANSLTLAVGDVIDMAGFNLFNTASGSGWTKSNDFTFTGFGTSSPYHQLVVDGTSLDTVVSAAGNGWVKQTGTVTSSFSGSSQTYNVYINTNKNAMLLIDTDITQTGVVV